MFSFTLSCSTIYIIVGFSLVITSSCFVYSQDQSLDLLPEVLQQQLKTGNLAEVGVCPVDEDIPAKHDLRTVQEPVLGNLLFKVPQLQWEGNGFVHSQS